MILVIVLYNFPIKYLQVEDTEEVVLKDPGYLRNLTVLLSKTPKRTIANYMFWQATKDSLGDFNEAARKIQLEFTKKTAVISSILILFPS